MGHIKNLFFVLNHPLTTNNKIDTIKRLLKWQITSKLLGLPVVHNLIGNTRIIIKKGITGATGNYYVGLHEFDDMGFLLHFLRPKDIFFDIGANVGSYTLLASGHCKTRTHSFEPVPSTFNLLQDNINLNSLNNLVNIYNSALGNQESEIYFTNDLDSMNHVASEKEIQSGNVTKVKISTLDKYALEQCPLLMKIDVEGFETEVLNGGYETLKNKDLKAIIIELNGSGIRYGYDEGKIHKKLLEVGFHSYSYTPKSRKLTSKKQHGHLNTIYIRDLDFVYGRIDSAKKIKVFNQSF